MNALASGKKSFIVSHQSIASFIMLIYLLLYEWGIFEVFSNVFIYPIKMLLPFSLLLFSIKKKINNTYYNNFLIAFFIFIIWSLFPSFYNLGPEETIEQWLKYFARFVFIVLAGNYLMVNQNARLFLMKSIVLISVLSLIQYVGVYFFKLTNLFSFSEVSMARGTFYGPLGLLGEVGSVMNFGIGKIYRLHGFWFEPSMTSAFMFSSFFLSKCLFQIERKIIWKRVSYLCLVGGFLCFSNAGYLSIGMAMIFGLIINLFNSSESKIKTIFKLSLPVLIIFIAIFGRAYVASNLIDIDIARAIVGVRGGSCAGTTCGGVDYSVDPSDGRLGSYSKLANIVNNYPLGIGIRTPGEKYDRKTGFTTDAGNAILGWAVYTGYIGIFLLFLRELQVLLFSLKNRKNNETFYLSQAWIVIFFQNMLYGTLMTPFYLLVIILIFSSNMNKWSLKLNQRTAIARLD